MKSSVATMAGILICAMPVVHGENPEAQSALENLGPVIRSLLEGLDGASVTFSDRGLEASYRVQEFQVHTVQRDGTISGKPRTQRGPNKGGFLLQVAIRPEAHYHGPIMLSPEGYGQLRYPYWQTQVREIRMPGSNSYVWITLAMGTNVDEQLMADLQAAIHRQFTV